MPQADNVELYLLADVNGAEDLRLKRVVHSVSHLLRQQAIALYVDFKFFLDLAVIQFSNLIPVEYPLKFTAIGLFIWQGRLLEDIVVLCSGVAVCHLSKWFGHCHRPTHLFSCLLVRAALLEQALLHGAQVI